MLTKEQLDIINVDASDHCRQAVRILYGETDGYDGADGARYVIDLTDDIFILLGELYSQLGVEMPDFYEDEDEDEDE